MLGFTSLAEAPLSALGGTGNVLGLVSSVSLTPAINLANSVAKANTTNPSVTASFALAIEFDAKANTTLTGSSLASSISAFSEIEGDANNTLTSIPITTTAAIAPASAKGTPDNALSSLSSLTSISSVDFDAEANITTASNLINTSITADLGTFIQSSASVFPFGIQGTFTANLGTPTAVQFDYESIKDIFSGARTVHIINSNLGLGNVVHVSPENFKVVIDAHKDIPTTVLITV